MTADGSRCEKEYLRGCAQHESMYDIALNPVYGHYSSFLFMGVLGKKILNKQKLLKQYDYLINESHIERLRMALTKIIEVKR